MYPIFPILLYNSKFRHYRIKCIGKNRKEYFKKLNKKIYNSKQLKNYLDRYNPIDVYQTISWWFNPQLLGSRRNVKGFPLLNNFFLGSDYLMDFDIGDYTNKLEMINNVKLAILSLREVGFIHYILLRTGQGYQLIITDFNIKTKEKLKAVFPRDREYAYGMKMKELTDKLIKMKVKWDWRVSIDTRRLCRVPNTLHRNGNTIKILKVI